MRNLKLDKNIKVNEDKIKYEFFRSTGPGGQNKNKVSTAVRLRLNLLESGLSEYVIKKIKNIAPSKVTAEEILIIEATNHRTQEANRKEALDRLAKLINRAALKPKKRKPTKVSKTAIEKRLKNKKIRSEIKDKRQRVSSD